ncbi:hypothetical protein Tco_0377278 [Tanacetum coccineum]
MTRDTYLDHLGEGQLFYVMLFEIASKGFRQSIRFKHRLSPSNGRAKRADNPNHGVHVEGLCDRLRRSPLCWLEGGERQLTRLDIIQEMVDKITAVKERLRIARSR